MTRASRQMQLTTESWQSRNSTRNIQYSTQYTMHTIARYVWLSVCLRQCRSVYWANYFLYCEEERRGEYWAPQGDPWAIERFFFFFLLALTKDVGGVDQHRRRQGHHQSDQQQQLQHSRRRRHRDSRTYQKNNNNYYRLKIAAAAAAAAAANNNNWRRNGRNWYDRKRFFSSFCLSSEWVSDCVTQQTSHKQK